MQHIAHCHNLSQLLKATLQYKVQFVIELSLRMFPKEWCIVQSICGTPFFYRLTLEITLCYLRNMTVVKKTYFIMKLSPEVLSQDCCVAQRHHELDTCGKLQHEPRFHDAC